MKEETQILVGDTLLSGSLVIPETAKGIIVFAHGSGSSRHSTRNKKVASALQEAGFATLLFDLLTEGEDQDFDNRFDIDLLAERLIGVTDWLKTEEQTGDLAIGFWRQHRRRCGLAGIGRVGRYRPCGGFQGRQTGFSGSDVIFRC